jgi:HSP20 family protein
MARYGQLSRWEPLHDIMSLQNELSRLFGTSSNVVSAQGSWMPSLDVYEAEDRFVINVDLPGVRPDDIDVTLDQNMLTVKGERRFEQKVDQDNYHRVERTYGAFHRTLSLPSQVDADGIQAEFRDGVLEVVVPKEEVARPRKIKVGEGAREITA